jgi:WD40 repeat protein
MAIARTVKPDDPGGAALRMSDVQKMDSINWVAISPDGRRIASASQDQAAWLWDGVTGQSVAPLRGHTEAVWHAAFSPDGRRVVTASAD